MKLIMKCNGHNDDDEDDDEKCVNQHRGGLVSQVDGSGCILPIGRNLGIALHFAMLQWTVLHFVLCSSTLHWIVLYSSKLDWIVLHFTDLHYIKFHLILPN